MQELKRQRKIQVGSFEVELAVPERTAARISASPVYRRALRPTAKSTIQALRWASGARRQNVTMDKAGVIPAIPPTPDQVDQDAVALIQEVAPLDWYQSIHVGHGVVTPGLVNHYANLAEYRLPESLAGMRCLDAAPRDGFWAFEMERRGAAEVVALDLQSPDRRRERACFETAARLLDSRVEVKPADLYRLASSDLGKFDLIVFTDHMHLIRDPQLVIEGLYAICRGQIILSSLISPDLERHGGLCLTEFLGTGPEPASWWLPNINTLRTMLGVGGFMPVDVVGRFDNGAGPTAILHGRAGEDNPWSIYAKTATTVQEAPAQAPETGAGPVRHERRLKLGRSEVTVTLSGGRAARLADAIHRRRLRRTATKEAASAPQGWVADAPAASNGSHTNGVAATVPAPATPTDKLLAQRVAAIPWYHTIELGHGIVTPGFVDHREQLPYYHLPESLAGMRCLDVATFDGFWAFEMERRGAAEVVGVDIADGNDCDLPRLVRLETLKNPEDKPMGLGFRIAHEVLGSKVKHQICSVYDLSPEKVGLFDFVNLGDLLLHLRDPQLALQSIASVCRGTFWMAEVYVPALEGYGDRRLSQFSPWLPSFTWWLPSTNTLRAMMAVAGFTDVEELDRVTLKTQDGSAAKVVYRAKGPAGR